MSRSRGLLRSWLFSLGALLRFYGGLHRFLSTRFRLRRFNHVLHFGIPPQIFQSIKLAEAGAENVHHNVYVVQQDPVQRFHALSMQHAFPMNTHFFFDVIDNRTNMLIHVARANHKIIRQRFQFPKIQNSDVTGFLFKCGRGDVFGQPV